MNDGKWTYLHKIVAGTIHGTNSGGLLKDSCDLRIHLDIEVVLLSTFFMPCLNTLINPITKWLADDGIDDVSNVLAWQLL